MIEPGTQRTQEKWVFFVFSVVLSDPGLRVLRGYLLSTARVANAVLPL